MASAEGSSGEPLDQRPTAGEATHHLPAIEDLADEGIRGSADGTGLRIGVACSRFNAQVTRLLLSGALAELDRCAVTGANRTVAWVSGAFELPLAALVMARTRQYDAIICLGAVIRGETSHYDFVAGECAHGIQRVQLDMAMPVVFGVLTTENLDQALARAGGALGNKGTEAVASAIEMATLLRHLVPSPAPARATLADNGKETAS